MKKEKLVYGLGINDSTEPVQTKITVGYVNGKQKQRQVWMCPYYSKWLSMLCRCYSDSYQKNYSSYTDCSVCVEWFTFSNFKRWVDEQPCKDWQTKPLDKDLIVIGNKIYSPDTCAFVDTIVNGFINDTKKNTGKCLKGVTFMSSNCKYAAQCNNPFKKQRGHIGYFDTEMEAHLAWKAKKHEYACQLADLQEDPRVAEALRNRYKPD